MEQLEVNQAVLEIMTLARTSVSDHGVLVNMELSDGLPLISGDKIQLQQVILNLVVNAVEAMSEVEPGARELLVTSSMVGADCVLVAVSDSGPGLPQANIERLFEAFYTTKPGGLGLGLSICRSIVEAHGGRLWATPREPQGSVFSVTLPVGQSSLGSLESSTA